MRTHFTYGIALLALIVMHLSGIFTNKWLGLIVLTMVIFVALRWLQYIRGTRKK